MSYRDPQPDSFAKSNQNKLSELSRKMKRGETLNIVSVTKYNYLLAKWKRLNPNVIISWNENAATEKDLDESMGADVGMESENAQSGSESDNDDGESCTLFTNIS